MKGHCFETSEVGYSRNHPAIAVLSYFCKDSDYTYGISKQ